MTLEQLVVEWRDAQKALAQHLLDEHTDAGDEFEVTLARYHAARAALMAYAEGLS